MVPGTSVVAAIPPESREDWAAAAVAENRMRRATASSRVDVLFERMIV